MPDNSSRESIDKILHDAPTARKNLLDNHSNLHRLADYCQNKYFNVDNTRSVIEESRAFTTQALASVTYQINNLAASLLKLLDAQTLQLKQMESSVNMLSQTVDIFKENVARREIGVLTTGSIRLRTQKKALPPNGPEPPRLYRRTPISYTRLDKLGHSHWERNKTEESTEKENRQSFQQISAEGTRSSFSWPFQGFAVPPPSVPDFAGSNITAPPACSPASPSPPIMSACSPSPPPYAYQDLSMLPPPPPPYDEMEDAPPPPPPSPPQSNMPSFPPNTSVTLAIPPPPPTQANMAIPPPPPPPPTQGKIYIPPPPPPPPSQGNMAFPAPPPPPPPPTQGNMVIPPSAPPPPARSSSSAPTPTPPPLPPQSTPMVPPPPPLPNTGGKFVPPPPPPLPQFKC